MRWVDSGDARCQRNRVDQHLQLGWPLRTTRAVDTGPIDGELPAGWTDRPGTRSGLEHDEFVRPEPQRRPPRYTTWKRRRQFVADDVERVGAIVQPQCEAKVGVGADVVGHHARRTLGREEEMDAEAAAALGDPDERREEVGQFLGEGGELVDHHDEPGKWFGCVAPVHGEVVGSNGAQQPFAPSDLGVEADERTLGEALVEIGHDPDGVGQPGAGVERGTALEVDEHERQMLGAHRRGERHDQRAQEFALAGAGGSGDEAVGAVAHEVDVDGPIARAPDRGAERGIGPGAVPSPSDLVG